LAASQSISRLFYSKSLPTITAPSTSAFAAIV
jgi:hypothetical protein